MILRCWGARGSIPVSGAEYIRYGGDTTCFEIRSKNDAIIIVDAGTGIRRLGNRLRAENRSDFTMLFTHSHWDHILGFPFFSPLYESRTKIQLFGCPLEQGDIQKLLAKAMSRPYFPLAFEEIKAVINYTPECRLNYPIDTIEISTIKLNHPNLGSGFKFTEGDKVLVLLTDNELGYPHRGGKSYEEYVAFARGADLLLHDAEYTPEEYKLTRSWGHSTFIQATQLALDADVKAFGLIHHNQDRSDDQLDEIVSQCQHIIGNAGRQIKCLGLTQTTELQI